MVTLFESVQLNIKNNEALHYFTFGNTTQQNFTSYCELNNATIESFTCPYSNVVLYNNCSGDSAGVLETYCPVVEPSCQQIDVSSLVLSAVPTCTLVNHTAALTSCVCSLTTANNVSNDADDDYSLGSDDIVVNALECAILQRYAISNRRAVLSTKGVADLVGASVFVAQDFRNTFRSQDELGSKQGALKAAAIITFILSLWGVAIILCWYVAYNEYQIIDKSNKDKDERLKQALAVANKKQESNSSNGNNAIQSLMVEQMKMQIIEYVSEIMPAVYSLKEKTFSQRLWREITLHHSYLHLFLVDHRKPNIIARLYRTMKVLGVTTLSMFLQAVLFNLQNPSDDGSCLANTKGETCLQKRTALDSSISYCAWTQTSTCGSGYCEYNNQPAPRGAVLYIIIIITAVVTAVAKVPIDHALKVCIAPVNQQHRAYLNEQYRQVQTRLQTMHSRIASVLRRSEAVVPINANDSSNNANED